METENSGWGWFCLSVMNEEWMIRLEMGQIKKGAFECLCEIFVLSLWQ